MMLLLFLSHSHHKMLGCHTRVNDASNHLFLRRNIIKFRKSRTMCSSAVVVRIELGSDAKVSAKKTSQRRNPDLRKKEKKTEQSSAVDQKSIKTHSGCWFLTIPSLFLSLPLRCKRYTFTAALEKCIQIQFQLFVFAALITLGLRLDAV